MLSASHSQVTFDHRAGWRGAVGAPASTTGERSGCHPLASRQDAVARAQRYRRAILLDGCSMILCIELHQEGSYLHRNSVIRT